MNQQEFVDLVQWELGDTLIDVELEPDDVEKAFHIAKKTFQQKGNDNLERSFFCLNTVPDQSEYQIPGNINTVNNVVRPQLGHNTEDAFGLSTFNELFQDAGSSQSNFLIYNLTLQILDNISQYMVYDPEFVFNRSKSTVRFLKKPDHSMNIFLDVYNYSSDETYRDNLWIYRYTVAECKGVLGRAYRKFQQLSTPSGETGLDGSDLVQESQQEKEKLLEEILDMTDGDETAYGVFVG